MAKKFLRIVIVFAACSLVVNSIRTPPLKATVNDADKKNADVEQAQIHHHHKEITKKGGVEMEMYPTGSSLPDCSYACGPCSPCKRVMISFQCSVAESCSVIYRCTCRGRYYHVPSRA
ncbi:hypothetical protein CARUB_v10016535mg [Capsella rubella]|uniref:Epidermal patterning factor-like protein n=1 Tax=Capsella rubella TaxID=81985 RepID=R0ETR5_9BRAS|nr:hypothetical protein CARUB_v10016535mg [Capsella rubella]